MPLSTEDLRQMRALADQAVRAALDRVEQPRLRMATVQARTNGQGTVSVRIDGDTAASPAQNLTGQGFEVGQRVAVLLVPPHGAYIVGSGSGAPVLPTGTVLPYAVVVNHPAGFEPCDGRVLDRTEKSRLFAVIGTTFNTGGEAATQFRTPDLRGRTWFGIDNYGGTDAGRLDYANNAGGTFGSQRHSSVISHTHSSNNAGYHSHWIGWQGSAAGGGNGVFIDYFGGRAHDGSGVMGGPDVGEHSHGINAPAGAVSSIDHMPPGIMGGWIIKD